MLCRGLQDYGMQHKEMGQGPLGPEKAVAWLYIVRLCTSETVHGWFSRDADSPNANVIRTVPTRSIT